MDRLRRALEALDGPAAWQRLRWALIAASVAVGALDAWFYRQWNVNPDGISYIDLARAFAAHGPAALINGYWSPLFPATIGAALTLIRPDADTLYPLVRAVGFIVFVTCVAGYDRFLRALIPDAGSGPARWTRPLVLLAAWMLFFLLCTQAMGMHLVTPDFGVAAAVFWVAAEFIALEHGTWSLGRWVRLGVALGLGYWWKAILFPVSGVALVCAAWIARRRRDGLRGPAMASATFAVMAALLAVPVSLHVHRPTFGETGRLNQLWFVNHATTAASFCLSPEARLAPGPSSEVTLDERLLTRPLACRIRYEWPEATLPIWYDPSAWYENVHATVRPSQSLGVIGLNLSYLRSAIAEFAPVAGVALIVLLAAFIALRADLGARWPLVAFAATPIGFYLLVYVELRHVVPFLLVLTLITLVSLTRRGGRAAGTVIAIVALAAAFDGGRRLLTQQRVESAITVHELQSRPRPEQLSVRVARALAAQGLVPGDRMASINTLWNVDWAHRAGLVVRAYVPEYTYPIDRTLTELADPCTLARFDAAMRDAHIKGVVLRDVPGLASPPGWDALDDTGYRLRLVPGPAATPAACASH